MNKVLLAKRHIKFKDPNEIFGRLFFLLNLLIVDLLLPFVPFWKRVMLLKEVIDMNINVNLGNDTLFLAK